MNCAFIEIHIPGCIEYIDLNIFNGNPLTTVYFDGHIPNLNDNIINKIDNVYIFRAYYNRNKDGLLIYFNNVYIIDEFETGIVDYITYRLDKQNKYACIINIDEHPDNIELQAYVEINNINYKVISINEPAIFGNNLISIILPDTITTIDTRIGGDNLMIITLPKYIKYIYDLSFRSCINLVDISLPDDILYIGFQGFFGCESIKNIKWPSSLKTINDYAFQSCNSLEILELPDSIEYIGLRAFANCNNIKTIKFPKNLKYIGESAFSGCTKLTHIDIQSNINICERVFADCKNLTTVNFSSKYIFYMGMPGSIFQGCFKLLDIYIEQTCLDIIIPYLFGDSYSLNLKAHISLFSPPPTRLYKYDTYPKIVYEYFKLDNFLIGTYDNKPYDYEIPRNLSINKYDITEKQIIYIPNECIIYDIQHKIDRILNNTFNNVKTVIFPPTKFTLEKDSFTNAINFVFTGEIPELNNIIKYQNVYILPKYNKREILTLLRNHFINVYVRFSIGVSKYTPITCLVNNTYLNINVEKISAGTMVKTRNGNKKVIRVLRVRNN